MGDHVLGALQRAGDALLGEKEMTCGARSVRAEMPLRRALVLGPAVAVVGVARMSAQLGRLGPTSRKRRFERYRALVPEGAFEEPTIIQITPITDFGVGLDLVDFPVVTSLDQAKIQLVGAVNLEFEGEARRNIDISVPSPADALVADQYIATEVISFRGVDEQRMVDQATFDPAEALVKTGFIAGFPLIVNSGIFGVHRATECLAFATGWVTVGDVFNAGYLPGGVSGALLPFPIVTTERTRFALPVPCNRPVQVEILTFAEQPIDSVPCGGGASLQRAEVCELDGVLSDDTRPPAVQDSSTPDGAEEVDPLAPISVTFDESLAPESVTPQSCGVTSAVGGVKGKCVLSPNGRVLTFVPDIRLRFGETYTLTVNGVFDQSEIALEEPFTSTFTTFEPHIVQHIEIDARDVVWIPPATVGRSPCDDLIAVAEGDAYKADSEGGISIFDVTDVSVPPSVLSIARTAGVDRALTFAAGGVTTTGQSAQTFAGPSIMSVDGAGDPERFGAWRLFDLSQFPTIRQVATRLVNQSATSWGLLNLGDPQGALLGANFERIPNDVGVPLDVAAFGTQISYIANAPHIGLQAVVPQGMNADLLAGPQVDGTLLGLYRAVGTVKNRVLGVRQDGNENTLVLVDAQLGGATGTYALPGGGRPLFVSGLNDWESRSDFGAEQVQARDLAVTACKGVGLCVLPVNAATGTFEPTQLANGMGHIRTPGGNPRGAVGDPITKLLFVADGSAGLTIIDLAVPGGSRDEDGNHIDDRVLASVDLNGARAQSVVMWRDAVGKLVIAVAAGADGIYIIDPPPTAGSGDSPVGDSCLSIVAEHVNQDDPANTSYTLLGDGQATVYGGSEPSTSDNLKLRIAAAEDAGISNYAWSVSGPGAESYAPPPPSAQANEWSVGEVAPATGTLTFKCVVTLPNGTTAEVTKDIEVGVRTDDVIVIGWINGANVTLPADAQADFTNIMPPSGPPVPSSFACNTLVFRLSEGSTSDVGVLGLPVPLRSEDRDYILHWLFKYADNDDPLDFIPGPDFRDSLNQRIDEDEVEQFVTNAMRYKLFSRLQVKYRAQAGKFRGAPTILKQRTAIGTTVNPCGTVMGGLATFEGQKAYLDRWLTKEDDRVSLINDGSPDAGAVAAFNTVTGKDVASSAAVFWEDIGTRISFSIAGGTSPTMAYQPYPTYYEFRNGRLFTAVSQADTPRDNFNGSPHPFGTTDCVGLAGTTPGGRCGNAVIPAEPSARIPPSGYTCPPRCS